MNRPISVKADSENRGGKFCTLFYKIYYTFFFFMIIHYLLFKGTFFLFLILKPNKQKNIITKLQHLKKEVKKITLFVRIIKFLLSY